MKFNIFRFSGSVVAFSLFSILNMKATAQITPDNTLGAESSEINSIDELRDRIEGGARRGDNLFHSFQEFSIGEGFSADFANPEGIANIFSRVTGGNISEIFGELGVDGTANLFFLNPNGIIFGENARLNVNGSFLATTSDNIEFDNGSQFSAVNPDESLLSIEIPIGLGFGSNSGNILVNGNGQDFNSFPLQLNESKFNNGLQIEPSNTLALIGGDVNFNGGIALAEKGRIEIGSVENGNVEIIPDEKGFVFDYKNVLVFNNINFTSQSFLNSSGEEGGSININGRLVNISDGSTLVIENRGLGSTSGNFIIRASDSIKFELKNSDVPFSGVLATQSLNSNDVASIILDANQIIAKNGAIIYSSNLGNGTSGDISVDTNNLTIADNSILSTINFGNGIGGNIFVNSDNFTSTNNSFAASINFGNGVGGDVFVNSDNIAVLGGSNIGSANLGEGIGGDVFVMSNSIDVNGIATLGLPVSTLSASTLSSGKAGNLSIQTSSLSIKNGAEISSSTLGSGSGGTIAIDASEFVEVEGFSPVNRKPSQIIAGGNDINLPQSLSFDFNSNILIPSDPNQSLGTAGNVILNTPSLKILNGAAVAVRNSGTGDGGELTINAESITLNESGEISASTLSGEGGNITLNSENLELLNQSQITASAGGEGNGGNIDIDSDTILGLNNSDITANAVGGNGGNINIESDVIVGLEARSQLTPFNDITASSELGVDGTVTISSPENNSDEDLIISAKEAGFYTGQELYTGGCNNPSGGGMKIAYLNSGDPESPDDFYDDEEPLPVDNLATQNGGPSELESKEPESESDIPPLWSEGDPAIEGNMIQTNPDGSVFFVAVDKMKTVESMVCTHDNK